MTGKTQKRLTLLSLGLLALCAARADNGEENLICLRPRPAVSWVTNRTAFATVGPDGFVLKKTAADKAVRMSLQNEFYPAYTASEKVRISFEYRGGSGRMAVVSYFSPMESTTKQLAPCYTERPFYPTKDWQRVEHEITLATAALDLNGARLSIDMSEGSGILEVRKLRLEECAPARRTGRAFRIGGVAAEEIAILATEDPLRHEHELRAARMFRYILYTQQGAYLPVRTVSDSREIGPNAVLIGAAAVKAGIIGEAEEAKHLVDFDCGCVRRAKGTRLGIVGGFPSGPQYGVWRLFRQLGVEYLGVDCWRSPAGTGDFVAPEGTDDATPAVACRFSHYHNRGGPMPELRGRTIFERLMCDFSPGLRNGGHCRIDHSMPLALVTMEEFRSTHPEYFAMNAKGERQPATTASVYVQYCLSNPDLARLVGRRMVELMRANPCAKLFPISPGDGSGNDCKCPNCRALGTTADVWMTFCNRVAEVTSVEFPDRYLHTSSYVDTPEPPRSGVRPHPNVNGNYCVYPRPYWPSCLLWEHPSNDRGRAALADWRKIIPRIALIYYPAQCSRWMDYWPSFDMDVAVVRDFARSHALYTRYFGLAPVHAGDLPQRGGFCDLRLHVLGRIEEDPDVAVEPLVDDFMRDFYGEAAKPLRAFFDLIRGEPRRRQWIQNCELQRKGLITPELGRRCLALLDRAEALSETAAVRRRLLREKQNFLWTYLDNVSIGCANVPPEDRAFWMARLGEFCRIAVETGVEHMGNGGGGFARQWFHNLAYLNFPENANFAHWTSRVPEIRDLATNTVATVARLCGCNQVLTNGSYLVRAKDFAGSGEIFRDTRSGFLQSARTLRRKAFGTHVASLLFDLKADETGARQLFVCGAVTKNPAISLEVNGVEVFAGASPFGSNGWTEKPFALPEGLLKAGRNRVVLRNVTEDDPATGNEALLRNQMPYWGWLDVLHVRLPCVQR